MRDPRNDPKPGDVLLKKNEPEKCLVIDFTKNELVYYSVFLNGNLQCMLKKKIGDFKELAMDQAIIGGKTDEKP